MTFHSHADTNTVPAPHQSDANLRPMVYRPFRALFWALRILCGHNGNKEKKGKLVN
jgi:hypothetical protein